MESGEAESFDQKAFIGDCLNIGRQLLLQRQVVSAESIAKAMFDTGLAGPLAGLVVAVPVLWLGIQQAEFELPKRGQPRYDDPLLVELMVPMFHTEEDIRADLMRHAGNRVVVNENP